ncbi:glycosyltransferase family 9 protein [Methylotenera versatilis]|uniref:Glycosyl transferase family 9 n=1 Tax=Methylotenera versatilis (strain 301) TaxID=666681 RepID=D7DKE9_METV0|nr:glycosyltransferase family 9 protein [Methylotenera versatilis]ADI30395.1 glycosyl transferase family 9 [Methylotenera versatilis 301]
MKILAIQFKYLGDAVILTPALKALTTQIPNAELHVLVAAEIAPLLENLPWINKIWAMPRSRGKAKLSQALPFIKALRKEKFDRSIDFGGNDRGALLSLLSGARIRLGAIERDKPKLMQRICYTQIAQRANPSAPYFDLHFELLSAWNIKRPDSLRLETVCKHFEIDALEKILPRNSIICHITTSQPKKDWPITHWAKLHDLARVEGLTLTFSAGNNERERNLLSELKKLRPDAQMLPALAGLNMFLCALKSSRILICGDTGPLHFAEGLGIKVLGIFAVGNSIKQVAPIYHQDQLICAKSCACEATPSNVDYCQSTQPCMASIPPEAVFIKLKNILAKSNFN